MILVHEFRHAQPNISADPLDLVGPYYDGKIFLQEDDHKLMKGRGKDHERLIVTLCDGANRFDFTLVPYPEGRQIVVLKRGLKFNFGGGGVFWSDTFPKDNTLEKVGETITPPVVKLLREIGCHGVGLLLHVLEWVRRDGGK
jgi:hypothetical protein